MPCKLDGEHVAPYGTVKCMQSGRLLPPRVISRIAIVGTVGSDVRTSFVVGYNRMQSTLWRLHIRIDTVIVHV
jgi:hypothetical protein